MNMHAAVLQRQGVITLETLPVPEPAAGQVQVKVEAVGICGSDVHYYEHGRIGPYVVDHPLVLGHELSGTITAAGPGVDPARVGQRVAVEPQAPCRTCAQCKAGRYNLCPEIKFFATPPVDGAFTEYVVVPADFAFELPGSISFEAGALIEPLSVGLWACQKAGITAGSRVLIAGAGPIGVITAQVARALGASEVVISDLNAQRLQFALEHGATRVLDAGGHPLEADAFIDASGAEPAIRAGIMHVAPAGRVVLVGMGADEITLPVSWIQNRELVLTGVFRYANTWPAAISLLQRGLVDMDALVTGKFTLAEAEAALAAGREPGAMKAVLYPGR